MLIGYARVSTDDQNLALQLDALEAAGCAEIFKDHGVSAIAKRPGLTAALERCGPGDVLVAWKLDRLGRSVIDLVSLAERLQGREVGLRVLTGLGSMIDTTRPEGKFAYAMFAALAEFERALTIERTHEGIKAARRRNVHLGRPRKLTPERLAHAERLLAEGQGKGEVAALLSVGRATLRRALQKAGPT